MFLSRLRKAEGLISLFKNQNFIQSKLKSFSNKNVIPQRTKRAELFSDDKAYNITRNKRFNIMVDRNNE